MRIVKSVSAVTMIGMLVAACSGSPTQSPGGGGNPTANPGGGGTPTENPGGGGGTVDLGTGSIHLEVGGPVQETVDLPFFAPGARFGGAAGVALNFTTEGGTGIATIGGAGETWTISLISETLNANATECQRTNWNISGTSGSGTFDCKNGFAVKVADGTYLTGVTMKGNFTASQ